jgi:hypothetical protein
MGELPAVIAGLDPAIPIMGRGGAFRCSAGAVLYDRDGRVKPGHDGSVEMQAPATLPTNKWQVRLSPYLTASAS